MKPMTDGSAGVCLPDDPLTLNEVRKLVQLAPSDERVDLKVRVLGAIFVCTEGADEGLGIAIDWCSSWEDNPGRERIRQLWFDWRQDPPETGVECLIQYLTDHGIDWFTVLHPESVNPARETREQVDSGAPEDARPPPAILLKFSLVDELPKLQSEMLTSEPLCSGLAVKGQANVWYAEPNTGKTVMALWFLISDIQSKRLDPSRIFYFNLDDTLQGLAEKTTIAQLHGFHVISDGYKGFQARDFPKIIQQLILEDQCHGVVIVLDVLKKLVDIMDKGRSSSFGKIIRSFIVRGGTCIALAHTNKRRNSDGEPIYAGTSDILEDFDCGFIVYETDLDIESQTKTILFKTKKSRGTARKQASFQYSVREGLSYDELLASIREVDEADLLLAQQQRQLESDLGLIEVVRDGIRSGTTTKMALAALLVQRTQCSKRTAIRVIEQYEGNDPETHFWNFQVGPRGAKMYRLLGQ